MRLDMYYAIELYEKQDMTIRDVERQHFKDILEDTVLDTSKKIFVHKEFLAVQCGKMMTAYYCNEEKRNNMVSEILNRGYQRAIDFLNGLD
jgi:hypothetical protein